jgi:chorismate dehydratase
VHRLGVVSFLNARPLTQGLGERADVELILDVPAALPALLDAGRVDAALVPIIDVLRSGGRYQVVSDACIGSDGETMTVRVFSQTSPDRITRLAVDGDSHTSVALATVLWRELHDRQLEIERIDARAQSLADFDAVLLIGDKVVDPRRSGFAYEVDLGGAWKAHTGLPFVFAVWAERSHEATEPRSHEGEGAAPAEPEAQARVAAAPRGGRSRVVDSDLSEILSAARDAGVVSAARIAREQGPTLGWTEALAERYLTRCLKFDLDARAIEGANLFARLSAKYDLAPADPGISWPNELMRIRL